MVRLRRFVYVYLRKCAMFGVYCNEGISMWVATVDLIQWDRFDFSPRVWLGQLGNFKSPQLLTWYCLSSVGFAFGSTFTSLLNICFSFRSLSAFPISLSVLFWVCGIKASKMQISIQILQSGFLGILIFRNSVVEMLISCFSLLICRIHNIYGL